MESDDAGACGGKIRNQTVNRLHHQVNVDWRGDAVVTQRFQHHRADGQVRHIMVIHNIEMNHIRPGSQRAGSIFA